MTTDDVYRADGQMIQLRITGADGETLDWRPVAQAETPGLAFTIAASANVGHQRMAEVYTDALIEQLRAEGQTP